MKKFIILGVFVISGCASSNLMSISKIADSDLHDTAVINGLVADGMGQQCTAFIISVRPMIHDVLNAPTSGPLSIIAKKRAINLLYIKLTPQFEAACGPVLMDERRSFLKLFSPLG